MKSILVILAAVLIFATSTSSSATTTDLPVLAAYTNVYGRDIASSTNVRLSPSSHIFLEFGIKPLQTRTILKAELTVSSNQFDGVVSETSSIQATVSCLPLTTPHTTTPVSG